MSCSACRADIAIPASICKAPVLNDHRLDLRLGRKRRKLQGVDVADTDHAGASGSMHSVMPTVTYPAHTTMVTGLPPKLHGIVE